MRIEPQTDPAAAPPRQVDANASLRDEFLRMLVAQLEHQNPLEPQDGAEFVAQLAQFATVEQGARTNAVLDELAASQSVASGAGLATFVGKTATVAADRVDWAPDQGDPPELVVDLSGTASNATVEIVDADGKVVKTNELGPRGRGEAAVAWDGTDDKGQPLEAGTYEFRVDVESPGDAATGSVQLRGPVDAIEFTGGHPRVRVGAASVYPPSVLSIGQ